MSNRFNKDSSLDDAFSYSTNLDLDRFKGDPMSEVVQPGFLMRFAVSDGVVDNSLRFL